MLLNGSSSSPPILAAGVTRREGCSGQPQTDRCTRPPRSAHPVRCLPKVWYAIPGSMPTTYSYSLDDLPTDHPACYRRELETWADCVAARTNIVAGIAADIELRLRSSRPNGRATRDTLTLRAANQSTQSDIAALLTTIPVSQVSERAGLGITAAILSEVMDLEISEITLRGEKGDFWLRDKNGSPRGLCEISGSTTSTPLALYRTGKRRIEVRCAVRAQGWGRSRLECVDSGYDRCLGVRTGCHRRCRMQVHSHSDRTKFWKLALHIYCIRLQLLSPSLSHATANRRLSKAAQRKSAFHTERSKRAYDLDRTWTWSPPNPRY
jgi:hypothetical protein